MYDLSLQRIKSLYSESGTIKEVRTYLGDMEIQQRGDTTRTIHYVSASSGLASIVVKENNTYTYYYTATDHLGSITTVMDEEGEVVAEQSFDAWGRRRNVENWNIDTTNTVPTWFMTCF